MVLPRLAALRLEAENVLAMYLFPDQSNGLLQGVLLQEAQCAPAGGAREQAGQIRPAKPGQFSDPVEKAARARVRWSRPVIGRRTQRALLHFDPLVFRLRVFDGLRPDGEW